MSSRSTHSASPPSPEASPPAQTELAAAPAPAATAFSYRAIAFQFDVSFWLKVASLVLDEWKLRDEAHVVVGFYCRHDCTMRLRSESILPPTALTHSPYAAADRLAREDEVPLIGKLMLYHTRESFVGLDRRRLLEDSVMSWRFPRTPSAAPMPRFLITCYPDLKKYTFAHWCGMPCVVAWSDHTHTAVKDCFQPVSLHSRRLAAGEEGDWVNRSRSALPMSCDLLSVACAGRDELLPFTVWRAEAHRTPSLAENSVFVCLDSQPPPASEQVTTSEGTSEEQAGTGTLPLLLGWPLRCALFELAAVTATLGLPAVDLVLLRRPSIPNPNLASSPRDSAGATRSLLLRVRFDYSDPAAGAAATLWGGAASSEPSAVASSETSGVSGDGDSGETATAGAASPSPLGGELSTTATAPAEDLGSTAPAAPPAPAAAAAGPGGGSPDHRPDSATAPLLPLPTGLTAVGWELNTRGQPGFNITNLQSLLDPRSLSDVSVNMNLSLMRWRMLPELALQRIASQRVLLLGAGTLGCHLARDLLAWGVVHITFVDSGRVSYPNPVRQPLYEFSDAVAGGTGRFKAQAAAEALGRIRPGMAAAWHTLHIPSPGHAVHASEEEATRADVRHLEALVTEHDVVFLLTDTRESRWLPTLLAAASNKLAITVGLGFDSYVVMRHGCTPLAPAQQRSRVAPSAVGDAAQVSPGILGCTPRLGCFFCTDAVAPYNSTHNRTLDQQCTVTRPGVAPLACALASELFISLLHHPAGAAAPHDGPADITSRTASPLGLCPHQIRGFLTHLTPMLLSAPSSPHCTACGPAVIAEYRSHGFAFLLSVFSSVAGAGLGGSGSNVLERLAGLDTMDAAAAAAADGVTILEGWGEEEAGEADEHPVAGTTALEAEGAAVAVAQPPWTSSHVAAAAAVGPTAQPALLAAARDAATVESGGAPAAATGVGGDAFDYETTL